MRRSAAAGARSGAAVAAAAVLLLSACALGGAPRRSDAPEPALRIWLPGVVHWDARSRELALSIQNGTDRTVKVARPAPGRVRVALFRDSGPDRVCGHEPDAGEEGGGEPIAVAPGDELAVRVDLARACGALPPGEYRYEVGYEAPPAGPGPAMKLRPRYGRVVVEAAPPPPLERGSLGSGGGPAAPRP